MCGKEKNGLWISQMFLCIKCDYITEKSILQDDVEDKTKKTWIVQFYKDIWLRRT